MGLFSRKHSGRQNDEHLSPNGNGNIPKSPSPLGMKRANSNPAQNANLPDIPLPKAPDPNLDPAAYLRSIYAVRERTRLVMEKAMRNQLRHFHVDMTKFADTAKFVVSIIKVRYLLLACYLRAALTIRSEISIQITPKYHPTAGGSTSK